MRPTYADCIGQHAATKRAIESVDRSTLKRRLRTRKPTFIARRRPKARETIAVIAALKFRVAKPLVDRSTRTP
jgi:hypothetical protein